MRRQNLLNARDRLGASIIDIVAADVAKHGPEVIEQLRLWNVAPYARLVSDLVHFRKLATEQKTQRSRCFGERSGFLMSSMRWTTSRAPSNTRFIHRSIGIAGRRASKR